MRKFISIILLELFALFQVVASPLDDLRKSFVDASIVNYAPDDDVAINFIRYSDNGRANDVLLLQLYLSVCLPDVEVEKLIDGFDSIKKCWKDIDYRDMNRGRWPASLHVTRMYALAKLYKAGNEKWRGSESIRHILHDSMQWWYMNMPKSPNWWHNEVGVPKKFAAVLLLLREELTSDELIGGLKVLENSKFGRTGQNKVWLAGNNLMRGILIDDEDLVIKSRDIIAEEIRLTDKEGIQDDWSFHQHGPQIQFGNYGMTFVETLSFWMRVLKNTKYDFTHQQKEIVCNLMKQGICWSVYRGMMDPSYCGRQNFIDASAGKAYSLAVAAQNMAVAMDEEKEFFTNVSNECLYPDLYPNTLVGAKYYSRSDCGIYRTPSWYASVRMHSERTVGFEFTNRENTLANFSADGAVLLRQDSKEYDNIFACWDWRKVPGVTSYDDGAAIKCDDTIEGKRNHSKHVGGLIAEHIMAATMELNRDGLYALKTVIFLENCIVCLGTGIQGASNFESITTAIDQNYLRNKVSYGKNWIHHADRGYVSLDDSPIVVSTELQKGNWNLIDPAVDRIDEGRIFKCWFEHPVGNAQGKYEYVILPCAGRKDVRQFAGQYNERHSLLRVIRNDKECQAVRYKDKLVAICHKTGKYLLDNQPINAEYPSIIILGEKMTDLRLDETTR